MVEEHVTEYRSNKYISKNREEVSKVNITTNHQPGISYG